MVVSRPSTPAVRHQPTPNHHFRTPVVIEHREYYHEPEPSRQLTSTPSFSRLGSRNPYRQNRTIAAQDEEFDVESYDPREEERYYEVGTDGPSRDRISGRHSRRRSRSRISIDEGTCEYGVTVSMQLTTITGAEPRVRDPLIRHAPSPPLVRQRSSSVKITSGRDRESSGEDRRGFQNRSRASSRSQRRSGEEERSYGRYPPPVDDYDWYDKDGMRVRVREI